MNPGKTSDILVSALKKGGDTLMKYQGKSYITTVKESISSVVTEADLAAEKAILEILDSSSNYNIITEEAGYLDHGSPYTWVVDPLDGTSNFAAGLPWFGVIIALFQNEEPVMGGMYLPVTRDIYLTEKGKGSWKNGEALRFSESTMLEDQLVAYSFDFSDVPGKTESEMEILKKLSKTVRNIRSTNSLVDFCYTADGRLGAALNQTTKIWDIAVPWLLILEAKGKVTDIRGKEIRFDLSAEKFDQNYTILASGARLHPSLLYAIET